MGEAISKKKKWDEKMVEMLQPDIFGYVLDQGVRDLVVVLNLLGINTIQSDQGNYSDSPWVQFGAVEPADAYVGELEVKQRLMKEHGTKPEEVDRRSPMYNRAKEVKVVEGARIELQRKNTSYSSEFVRYQNETRALAEKVQKYIDEFYSRLGPADYPDDRIAIAFPYRDPRYLLHIRDIPFLRVISSQGKVSHTNDEEIKEVVVRRRKEMDRFTLFLKEKYFSS